MKRIVIAFLISLTIGCTGLQKYNTPYDCVPNAVYASLKSGGNIIIVGSNPVSAQWHAQALNKEGIPLTVINGQVMESDSEIAKMDRQYTLEGFLKTYYPERFRRQ